MTSPAGLNRIVKTWSPCPVSSMIGACNALVRSGPCTRGTHRPRHSQAAAWCVGQAPSSHRGPRRPHARFPAWHKTHLLDLGPLLSHDQVAINPGPLHLDQRTLISFCWPLAQRVCHVRFSGTKPSRPSAATTRRVDGGPPASIGVLIDEDYCRNVDERPTTAAHLFSLAPPHGRAVRVSWPRACLMELLTSHSCTLSTNICRATRFTAAIACMHYRRFSSSLAACCLAASSALMYCLRSCCFLLSNTFCSISF